jgi:hypothetical protein
MAYFEYRVCMDIFTFGAFVKQLQAEGFDATGDVFSGQVGVIVGPKGLDSMRLQPNESGIFFPLWELNDQRELVSKRQFHEIVANRPPDWTPFGTG